MNKSLFPEANIWAEKYRPNNLDDYIMSSDLKEKFQRHIQEQTIPHLLFEGPSGTGKSTLANILIRNIDCEVKYINASENRGIDTVRDTIMKYCTTSSFAPFKVLVLDEFSEFTPDGQNALRSVMERYIDNVRFILTCNNVDEIIDPIRGRCQEYSIIPPTKEQTKSRMIEILKCEKIDYDEDDLDVIIRNIYPNVRKIINYLDQNSIKGSLKLEKEFFKILQFEKKILDILKSSKSKDPFELTTNIRQILADTRIKNFVPLYRYLFDNIDEYTPKNKTIKVIYKICEGLKDNASMADREMNMAKTILSILEILTS